MSHSREYGGSYALLEFARAIGLNEVIYSRKEQWRQDALAMTAGRILWQGLMKKPFYEVNDLDFSGGFFAQGQHI